MTYNVFSGTLNPTQSINPAADHLQPVPICIRGYETRYRYMPIQCNTNTYGPFFFSHTVSLSISLPVDVCQMSPDSFKAHLSTIQLIQSSLSSTGIVVFIHLHSTDFVFFWFILLLLHNFRGTQLFSARGVILLIIELAPSVGDEDELQKIWGSWRGSLVITYPNPNLSG